MSMSIIVATRVLKKTCFNRIVKTGQPLKLSLYWLLVNPNNAVKYL